MLLGGDSLKIKDVEDIVGITSKNIRFYEREGLLCPKRNTENGYREYSEGDIKKLKQIKLFRKLGISIEQINLLQKSDIKLKTILNKQIVNLQDEINNLKETMELCIKINEQNLSFDEIDANLWLFKMIELELKGAKFMSLKNDEIIRFLPDKFKMRYYESIIKNGQIDNSLLEEITTYFENIYKEKVDIEELIIDVLKEMNIEERDKLLLLLKENNIHLYNTIYKNIFNFEDIITLSKSQVHDILEQFTPQVITKALIGASPKVNEYITSLFPHINFAKERQLIGSIPINEIIKIHNEILKTINNKIS